jgi:putative N6-adenine-specific DNA methylase
VRFFATAAKGTEPALRDELRELRLPSVRADRGGVHFEGDMGHAARACVWSRIAVRVLAHVTAFEARDGEALYEGVRAVDWTDWVTDRTTVAVRATCRSSQLTHSQFVAQKTKDAVVDTVRDRLGARPSVDREDPDIGIAVHLAKDTATIYLDVGGQSLHERGWRAFAGEAPLRETLAAAILRLSGWDRKRPLVDPMCGAGTVAIEAIAWARKLAPGLAHARFGFERWASHDTTERKAMADLRAAAKAEALPHGPMVIGSDVSPRVLELAERNARAAGVLGDDFRLERRDVRGLGPTHPPGFVVTNPPYGERLDGDFALYDGMAHAFRSLRDHTLAILAGSPAIGQAMRRRPDRYWQLYNGPLECRLLVYEIP